jgi:dephospho-CoA kinase
MKKIAVTGGIGSGKSAVCAIFERLGVPVFYADAESKKMLDVDPTVRLAVIDLLGKEAYSDQQANRKYIADKVFSNPELLNKLNAILHPAVFRRFDEWVSRQHAPYVIKEAAILFESGADKGIDEVIHVVAPMNLRIKRVISRDGVSKEDVERRMSKQWTDEQRASHAQYHLVNDEQMLLVPQVIALHEALIN